LNVAASNPSVDTGQELARSFEEEVKRLQQSVDLLVNNFVQSNRFAEEYRHKVEQQDLEESEQCQQITERLTQLSQVSSVSDGSEYILIICLLANLEKRAQARGMQATPPKLSRVH
jgi:hypothetical protein